MSAHLHNVSLVSLQKLRQHVVQLWSHFHLFLNLEGG